MPSFRYCAAVWLLILMCALLYSFGSIASAVQPPHNNKGVQTSSRLLETEPLSIVPIPHDSGKGPDVLTPATASSASPLPNKRSPRHVMVQPAANKRSLPNDVVIPVAGDRIEAGRSKSDRSMTRALRNNTQDIARNNRVLEEFLAAHETRRIASTRQTRSFIAQPRPFVDTLPPTLTEQQLQEAAEAGIDTPLAVWLPVREYVRGVQSMPHRLKSQHKAFDLGEEKVV